MFITTHHDHSHQAKLANNCTTGIRFGFEENHPVGTCYVFNPKTKEVTFMDKSFGEWNMVEKPAAVTVTYEGSYEKQKIEMVLAPNKNNYYYHNVVTHLESNDDIEENLLRNKFKMRLK